MPNPDPNSFASPSEYASALTTFLETHEPFQKYRSYRPASIEESSESLADLQRLLFDAGWSRCGWPVNAGGLGGDPRFRGAMFETLWKFDCPIPEPYTTLEILVPILLVFAPHLADAFLPSLLRGDEGWAQAFSEPDAGSDMVSLRTRMESDGDGYRLTGQKVWSTYGHLAQRSMLLARSGGPGHRGLTMVLVDFGQPGIEARPIRTQSGENHFTEILRHTLTETSARPFGGRLAELGWDDVLADDAPAALGLLFEIKGDTVANADALGPEMSRCLATASGNSALASVLVGLPGVSTLVEVDGNVMMSSMVAASSGVPTSVGVICGDAGKERLAILPNGTAFTSAPCHISDPSLELVRITATVPSENVQWLNHDVAAAVLASARALLSTEMVGLAAHVIASAVAYTGQRVQYGKAIGTFQALQHRIASAHALVTGARHLADAARETNDPWTALVAKAMAGQAAETACVQAQ